MTQEVHLLLERLQVMQGKVQLLHFGSRGLVYLSGHKFPAHFRTQLTFYKKYPG